VRDLAIASLFATGVALVPAAIALAPKAESPVVIVAAPWGAAGDAARIVAVAGGSIVSATGRVAIARFSTDGFVAQLYRAGALLVLDATLVTACLPFDRASHGASL
jgi:hypothetical protein